MNKAIAIGIIAALIALCNCLPTNEDNRPQGVAFSAEGASATPAASTQRVPPVRASSTTPASPARPSSPNPPPRPALTPAAAAAAAAATTAKTVPATATNTAKPVPAPKAPTVNTTGCTMTKGTSPAPKAQTKH